MSFSTLQLDIAGGVATLTLDRPDVMNAINQAMKDDLARALDSVEGNGVVRVLVITGRGSRAFCAGADIKERAVTNLTPSEYFFRQKATHRLFNRIEQLPIPVIASLNGAAYGGGAEIALCADIRLAAETASIGFSEVNLGVIPSGGGTQRLPRLIGASRAKQLIFTGTRLSASEAHSIGLLNQIVPTDHLAERTGTLAAEIASRAPLAVKLAKQAIDKGLQSDIHAALDFELYAAAILFDTDDRKEGMRAFLEKRAPNFQGH